MFTSVILGVVLILARPCTAYLVRMRDDMLLLHNRIAKVAVDRVDLWTTLTMLWWNSWSITYIHIYTLLTFPKGAFQTDALKTDIDLFFTITNCGIAGSRSLTRPMNFKFMCLSSYNLTIKISQWACVNFCSYRKNFDGPVHRGGPGVHVLYFPPSDGLLVRVGTFLCLNFFSRLFRLFPPPLGIQRCGGSRPCGKKGGERGGIFLWLPCLLGSFLPKIWIRHWRSRRI